MPAFCVEFPQITPERFWDLAHADFVLMRSYLEAKDRAVREAQKGAGRG